MNKVTVSGFIRDIEFSHDVGNVEYEKANLICPGLNGKEDDILSIRYKKFCNKYSEGDFVSLQGNLRSYSFKGTDKNTVGIYIFTYFDLPDTLDNRVSIDGRICKIDTLRQSKFGKYFIHFIIANNIFTSTGKKINSYIPCTAYGQTALNLARHKVNDKIQITGELHSHTYRKKNNDNEIEIKIAHELVVKDYEVI